MKVKAAHVHVVCRGTVTLGAVVTLAMHTIGPEAEAIAFCLTGIVAAWIGDVERVIRHAKLMGIIIRREVV